MLGSIYSYLPTFGFGQSSAPIISLPKRRFEEALQNLATCPLRELKRFVKYLKAIEHPTHFKAESIFKQRLGNPEQEDSCHSLFETQSRTHRYPQRPATIDVQDKTVLKGGTLSIKKIMAIIKERGDELTHIELIKVNDQLLEMIADKCPNLKDFRLPSGMFEPLFISTKGIVAIGRFKNLSVLIIENSCFGNYEPEDFSRVLAQDHFKHNLVELSLGRIEAGDSFYSELKEYQKLEKLTLGEGSEEKLRDVLSSPNLKKSIKDLKIFNASDVSDALLAEISSYTLHSFHLRTLSSTVTSAGIKTFLQNSKELQELCLDSSLPVDYDSMEAIGDLSSLQNLTLENCANIPSSSFKSLASLTQLTALSLSRLRNFGDEQFSFLKDLSLNALSLNFQKEEITLDGIIFLTNSQTMLRNLKHLKIQGIKHLKAADFSRFGNFALQTLQVVNCKWFNDESLELLTQLSIARSIESLEIKKCPITKKSIALLSRFQNLRILALEHNPALVSKVLLDSLEKHAPESLQALVLDCVDVKEYDFTNLLTICENLKIVGIANSSINPSNEIFKIAKEYGAFLFVTQGQHFDLFSDLQNSAYLLLNQTVQPSRKYILGSSNGK